ncbi:MAG: class I SAM-dependent methyltransferase, partial [Desulfobacterales bacterium]|nr:class I SAM-dependent methyltransferase [Desulfobacterales bacterium]
ARKLSDWQVFGVDRAFADYVLYDPEGHYACFDQEGGFQYFQAMMTLSGRALYADPQATRKYFDTLFQDLLPLLPGSNGAASKTAEKDGNRLIHNHIRDFETDNLRFIKADIAQLEIPPATAIRCMNLLIYFEPETREKMLQQIGDHLHNDGILIAGTNGLGIQSRYAVYRKGDKGLFPGEFAFSLDNLGHLVFMPWFTIHANDPEALLLADLAGAIRADHSFWPAFSDRLDELQQQHDICRREPDGFLHFEQEEMPYSEYLEKNARLWSQMAVDGFLDRAVSVLNRTGFKAWKNPVGDLAVEPPPGTLPLS